MDVRGTAYWNVKARYYSQENSPTEAYNKARLEAGARYWLETCGPTAAVNCLAVIGWNLTVTCPGPYRPQPEEVLMDFLNDPRNEEKLKRVRDLGTSSIPENQVPQYYPLAVREVFNAEAAFSWGVSWEDVTRELDAGNAVQLCLKSPGHFVAVVAYKVTGQLLCYNDSWGSRFSDGNGGHNRWMSRKVLQSYVQPYKIVYTA